MKNEFIPFQQALELKELGFDEECLFAYYGKSDLFNFKESDYELCGDRHNSSFKEDGRVSAPLYQQVFRWFREKHNLYAVIIPTITMYWTFKTMTVVEGIVEVPPYNHVDGNDYPTYEEAEVESVKELIKIVKQQITKPE
jgi:hypothetical protein